MRAEIISVGTELLMGQITNTNSRYLARRLADLGVDLYYMVTVGDNPRRLQETLETALSRADLVLTTGGLGPTGDDLTREAIAAVLGLPLETHPEALAHVEAFFRERGVEMTPNNRRQAVLPRGARPLENGQGTAPGILWEGEWRGAHKAVLAFPGPPRELIPMVEAHLAEFLRSQPEPPVPLVSRILRFCGIGESAVDDRLEDLFAGEDPTVAPYAKLGEVHLRLTTRADDPAAAARRLDRVEDEIRRRLGRFIYGRDEETLSEVVGRHLKERGWRLALAESCTAGLAGKRVTEAPGSSDYFVGAAVTYSNELKERLLGVPAKVLAERGAVSAETAEAMAAGVRRLTGADIGVAITGIAGPGGGTPEKPVGTVWFGLGTPDGAAAFHRRFPGDRDSIRARSAQEALVLLWLYLTGGREVLETSRR